MERAYALLNVKAVQETSAEWVVTGIASTPTTDRMGDVVEATGAKFVTPMPLLWQHDSLQPVGRVEFAQPSKKGIPFVAHIPKIAEAGRLKDRIDEAVQSLKYRLVGACSIGFRVLADGAERMKDGSGYVIKAWEWLELSLVTIPANPQAVITGIKSLDTALRAAPGQRQSVVIPSPGASGSATPAISSTRSPKGNPMKTMQDLRDERSTKAARMTELVELKSAESRQFSDDERAEFDGLKTDLVNLDDEITVKSFHETQIATAQPVATMTQRSATGGRGLSFVRKADPEDKFKGQAYVRGVIAKAMAALNHVAPSAIAEHRWGKTHPQLVAWIKANEVAGGGTGSGEWGAELVAMDGRYQGDFIEFLYGATAFDKLPFREVPANVTIKGQDGEATGYWVGESKAIPATKADYSTVNLTPLKVGALSVVSNDLIRYSSPAAEELVGNALREASAKRVDQTVFSAAAASAGVSPAGLLNGLSAIATTGTDEAAVIALIGALYAPFIAAQNSNGLYWVAGPAQAKAISLIRNSLGQRSFQGVTGSGGSLEGDPLVVGDNIDGSQLILLKPSDIYKIGDSGFEVSISKEATIEQRSDPTGATDTPVGMNVTGMTNMFQEDSTAIKVVRHINFAKRRSTAVAYTDTADFQGTAS
jgi:HK97 family phage prohead protease